jgi:O-antigen/teichoic acid export membrane protein
MLRRNVVANAVGQVWSAVLGIASVPLYIHFLGLEAYGLVAFLASVQALLSVLDLGLSTTANREVARRLTGAGPSLELRDLIRTLELAYASAGLVIVASIIASADWLIGSWITSQLPPRTLELAVIVFAATIGVRWPVALYVGVMLGAERQVMLNKALVAIGTLRTLGALLVLGLVQATLVAFLVWYLVAAALELALMAVLAWSVLPKADRLPRVAPRLMKGIWGFSLSVGGNSLLAALLKQSDRLIITKLLHIRFVGYYSAAHTAAAGLTLLARPVMTAALPRFTALWASGERERLAESYHRLSQVVAAAVAPAAAVMIFFAEDVLRIWTRSAALATNAATTLSVLAVANLVNAMMQLPFALQLAAGITWIALLNNAVSLALLLPLMYFLIERFGITGAGISWAAFNATYFLVIPHVMHRHVLPGHVSRWYFRDTLPFMIAALLIGGGVWLVRESHSGTPLTVAAAVVGLLIYGSMVVALSEAVRAPARALLARAGIGTARGGTREAVTLSGK